ncbi:MAG: single-stranded DNA-binding protein [Dehalococcoidia bacterium]|nr:single-stranded DNA-binding protein [Dehalococcoidia bacterium]
MASLNKVMLIGNTGRDAEMRYLSTGTAKTDFSLAVNQRRRNASGEWEDQPEWFNVVLFGDQAERISQYITKGKQLYVEGRLQTRSWDDDQGQKHFRTEVIANTVQFLDRRGSGGGDDGGDAWGDRAYTGPQRSGGAPAQGKGGGFGEDVDDLPFE